MILLRFINPLVWSNGFRWGYKLGRLAVECRLQLEYRNLRHAPRRTREATRAAMMQIRDSDLERASLLLKGGES